MIKLIIFIIIVTGIYGVFSYKDNKIIIDTKKGSNLIEDSKNVIQNVKEKINNNVEIKK
jgi:hypothetical protein